MRKPKEEPVFDPLPPPKIGTGPLSHKYLLIAILSVYNKTGLLDLAKDLTRRNVKLYGSGGTAAMVREAGFPIRFGLIVIYC
jgi:hypothetical protein